MLTQQYQQMKTNRNGIMPRAVFCKGVFTNMWFLCTQQALAVTKPNKKCYQLLRLAVDVSFYNIHCIEIRIGVCRIPLMSPIDTSA